MLGPDDFLPDRTFGERLIGDQQSYHVNYMIEMAKLSVICKYIALNLSLKLNELRFRANLYV